MSGFGFSAVSDFVDEEVDVDKKEGSDDDSSDEDDDNEPVRQYGIFGECSLNVGMFWEYSFADWNVPGIVNRFNVECGDIR